MREQRLIDVVELYNEGCKLEKIARDKVLSTPLDDRWLHGKDVVFMGFVQ